MNRKILVLILTFLFTIILGFTIYFTQIIKILSLKSSLLMIILLSQKGLNLLNLDDLHYDSYYILEKEQYSKDNINVEIEEDLQIFKYGGFYIGRYEAGIPKELQSNLENISEETNNIFGIPVSQKGIIP